MHPLRGLAPLCYRRLGRAEWDELASLEFDPNQVERFLGPLADIVTAVRNGPAHSLIGVEAAGQLVGFYVVHPDARDRACWWLGWFAIDQRCQGHGYGASAMLAALNRLRHVVACRRVRLLVAPDNARALRLYERVGFQPAGWLASTGERVLELALWPSRDAERSAASNLCAVAAHARRVFRNWRLRLTVGPHAAWVIGVERGPPMRGLLLSAGLRWGAILFASRMLAA